MGRSPLSIDVAKKDRQELRTLLRGGVQQVRVVLRALALLQSAEDASAPRIAKVIPLTAQDIRRLGHRYQQAGLGGTARGGRVTTGGSSQGKLGEACSRFSSHLCS